MGSEDNDWFEDPPLFPDDSADRTAAINTPLPTPNRAPRPDDDAATRAQPIARKLLSDEPSVSNPQIRASSAQGWEPGKVREMEEVRSRGPIMVLFFLVALVVVVLVALVLAALNVLGGGEDDASVDATDPSAEVVAGDETITGTDDPLAETSSTITETTLDPNALAVELLETPFVCDGGTREFAVLTNADPGEEVAFSSPQSSNLRAGVADTTGRVAMRWQCDPSQAPTVWEITATGATSARSATFSFPGILASAATDDDTGTTGSSIAGTDGATGSTASTAVEAAALTVEMQEDPFACNGETRAFAQLSGATPGEEIRFTSPQSPNLRSGEAGTDGTLPVRWSCDPDQFGTTWEITATGAESGATATFTVTGAAS